MTAPTQPDAHPAGRPQALLMGIDLGTSGAKVAVVAAGPTSARLAGVASVPYPTYQPRPGWAEQVPQEWWTSVLQAARRALEQARAGAVAGAAAGGPDLPVAGIGLSGQMHGAVCVDAHDQPVRPAIIWPDTRTAAEVTALYERLGHETVARVLQNPLHTGLTAVNILWLQRHEPDAWGRVRRVSVCKDYVRFRLTGEWAAEPSDGSGTGLMDAAKRAWSPDVLAVLDLPADRLPPLVASAAPAGRLHPQAAAALGLPPGIPVAAGAGDQAAGLIGHGLIQPGDGMAALGSGGQLSVVTERPMGDPALRVHAMCHAAPDRWFVMAATLSAGLALEWAVSVLTGVVGDPAALRDATARLVEAAARVAPGAEGLLFLPYLAGERSPHLDPLARGAWVGLRGHHGRAHLIRAVLEGVALATRDGLDVLVKQLRVPVRTLVASGTGASNPVWGQILADMCEMPLTVRLGAHASAVGAAALGGVTAGLWPSVAEAARAAREAVVPQDAPETVLQPDTASNAVYRRLYGWYRGLYPALRETSHALSTLSGAGDPGPAPAGQTPATRRSGDPGERTTM